MKKIIISLLLLFLPIFIYSQRTDVVISGTAIEEDGTPFIGVSISAKGTQRGTITDMDGNFSLTLPKGKHTIVVAFISYRSAEIVVDRSEQWEIVFSDYAFDVKRHGNNFISSSKAPVLSHKLRSETDAQGVLFMKDDIPASYRSEPVSRIKSIKPSGNGFSIKEAKGKNYTSGFKIDYTSSVDISSVGRLPKYQTEFAQGREGVWGDTYERFSWGPSVSELRAQGENVGIYSPEDFFRTGVSFGNTLNVKVPGLSSGITDIALGQRKNNSPIPNSYKEAYNVSLAMKDIRLGAVKADVGAYYNSSYGKLIQQGSNIATLMHAVYTTPPTYDNLNGLSQKDKGAWINQDGSYRSYDGMFADNPYALINELPDREKRDYLMTFIKTRYVKKKVSWQNNLSFDKLWNRFDTGTLPYIDYQRVSQRKDHVANIVFNSGFDWTIKNQYGNPKINLLIDYAFKHTRDKLSQTNEFPTSPVPPLDAYDKKLIRNSHDVSYGIKLDNENLFFNAANKHYFSNTAHSGDYTNIFPELGLNLKLSRMFDDLFDWDYNTLSFYGNIKRTIGEVSLIDRNPAVLSTVLNASRFRDYYEYQLPVYNDQLKPETYVKSEMGLRYRSNNGYFDVEINGYNYNTHNLVSPVIDNFLPVMNNIGRLRSYGYFIEVSYRNGYYYDWRIDAKLNFSQGKTKATAIYSNEPFIRLAGFNDIATVFAEGQPLGAIYGTSYQRTGEGEVIIDYNGFPLVNRELTKIGDPTPDFIMTLNPNISYKDFTLSLWFEYRHGGDRWNGTRAFMDYHGVSENTAKYRNVKQYVFEGVDPSGVRNATPVDFYDPSRHLSENRWVRYGMAGIGEEYIEKATFLRLSNLSLKYKYKPQNSFLESLSVGFSAKNLFQITSYKGVDPATQMFGYASANGLDLFNSPSMRSYSLAITLGF